MRVPGWAEYLVEVEVCGAGRELCAPFKCVIPLGLTFSMELY